MGRGVAQQSLDLLGVVQQTPHHFLGLGRLAQARLVGQRLLDADGLHAFQRDHLRQPVHLAVGHLQHAPDIPHGSLGQQRAEGDDLAHLVATILALHVADHLFAAVHAEVDVEVGHRDALGVQEPLEQQRIAQRVKVGDGQRIGHQRPRARAATGADRNALFLGPFDEIGHDQEVAGKAHLLDDAQLERQPRLVIFPRRGRRDHLQPRGQPGPGLTAQLLHLVVGELRQDRRVLLHLEGTAAGNLHRVFQRLGQVGEQRRHLGFGLEVVLRRQAAAGFLLVDIGAIGDAQERVVGLIHVGLGEIDIVGGDQRQAHRIGHLDQPLLGQPFGLGRTGAVAVALQFDIQPVGVDRRQPGHQRLRLGRLPRPQEAADRAIGAAGQADQPPGMGGQLCHRHLRKRAPLADVEAGVELHQIVIASLGLRQQHHRRRIARPLAGLCGVVGQRDLAADDRLHPRARRQRGKLQRAEHVVGVGHGDGGHPGLLAQADQLLHRHRAFQQ